MTSRELAWMGISPRIERRLDEALARETGMLVLCGPTGTGKTTLAEALLSRHPRVAMVGDLRTLEETCDAIQRAARAPLIGVVRSGESFGLAQRWRDMNVSDPLLASASVVTVTLRRPPRAHPIEGRSTDILVVEIIGADRALSTLSIAGEAAALVLAGVITDESARYHVPGYE